MMAWVFKITFNCSYIFLFFSAHTLGLNEERLWLPSNHERLYLSLKRSALAAERLERCTKVLRGTLDLDASTSEKPIFRILCLQESGKTYNEMVDGVTGDTLTSAILALDVLNGEKKQKGMGLITSAKERFWALCDEGVNKQTKLFNERKRVSDGLDPISFDYDGFSGRFSLLNPRAVFHIDFDAKDLAGDLLAYRAICRVGSQGIDSIVIRARKDK